MMQKETKFTNDDSNVISISYFEDTETYYIEIGDSADDQEPRSYSFSHNEILSFIKELGAIVNTIKDK